MLLRDYLIAIILVGMVMAGGALIASDLGSKYNVPVDTSFTNTYDKIQDVNTLSKSLEDSIGGETKTATLGILDVVINGAWKSLKLLVNVGGLINTMANDVGDKYGIPSVFTTGFIIIASIGIIFGILGAVFRRTI